LDEVELHLEQAGARLGVALDRVATRPNAVRVDDMADIILRILISGFRDV
jgi:hypothetical protein